MAVRDDFTAGEVLAAADLNDTFAVKAGTASPTFSGTVTVPVLQVTSSIGGAIPTPNRNLLYNGAMQVHQRGTSTTGITVSGYYTADRWQTGYGSLGTWTQSVETDAPTGSGFNKSLKMLCTTADASPAASDSLSVIQSLEGQDLQRIKKGTASAEQLTFSFWVKSNVTGTYIVEIVDVDNTRHVAASYTVSASATWERKTLTFPADTTGTFDNDNASSFNIRWWLGAGTDFTSGTLATTWASTTSANRAVGQTNLAAATNNYWQVTGVQLEVGPVATAFEFKSFGRELAECQRYYQRFAGGSTISNYGIGTASATTAVSVPVHLKGQMRVEPTAIETSNIVVGDFSNAAITPSAITISSNTSGPDVVVVQCTVTGATQFRPYGLINDGNAAGYVAFSAEL